MVFAAILGCLALAQQGEPTGPTTTIKEEPGFLRATFTCAKGTITVILPSEINPGDTISGTFFPDAKAKDVTDVQIDLGTSHGPPPEIVNSPRRKWDVPPDAGPRLSLTVWTTDGTSFGTTYVNIGTKKPKPTQFNFPNFMRIGATAVINGPFDGDAENTVVKSTGVECAVVAESPRNAIVLVPSSMKMGQNTVELSEPKQKAEGPARFLSVQISSPKGSLSRGEVSTVTVKVDGLLGMPATQSAMIVLENMSPKVIDIEGKQKHFLFAKATEDGTYSWTLGITSLINGKFAVGAYVDPGPGTKIDPTKINNSGRLDLQPR